MTLVVGVDARRGGWALAVVESREGPGRHARARVAWHTVQGQDADAFAGILTLAADLGASTVGVDTPVGLPSVAWRPCDLLAKRRLGRGAARVFLVPPREVLLAPTYADARVVARRVLAGLGVSAQAYGIRRTVLAVDEALGRSGVAPDGSTDEAPDDPGVPEVVEVHPELSFMAMLGRAPGDPLPGKRTPAGRAARLAAAASWVDPDAGDGGVPDGDDHLDALAAAWSALRHTTGAAEVLTGAAAVSGGGAVAPGGRGPVVDTDERGLPMRIVV